jgi:hypothetical protein
MRLIKYAQSDSYIYDENAFVIEIGTNFFKLNGILEPQTVSTETDASWFETFWQVDSSETGLRVVRPVLLSRRQYGPPTYGTTHVSI